MIESPQLRHDRIEDYASSATVSRERLSAGAVQSIGSVGPASTPAPVLRHYSVTGDMVSGASGRPAAPASLDATVRGTLILVTRFDTASGSVELIDFMPLRSVTSHVIRIVKRHFRSSDDEQRDGTAASSMDRRSRGSKQLTTAPYAQICGPEMVLLRSPAPHRGLDHATVADFTVQAEDCIPLMLSYCPSHQPLGPWLDPQEVLRETEATFAHEGTRSGVHPRLGVGNC